MEIHLNSNIGRTQDSAPTPVRPNQSEPKDSSPVNFEKSSELNRMIAGEQDARPELVENGKLLAAQESYPPEKTIVRIANLLAANLEF